MSAFQKLLWPDQTRRIVDAGDDSVGGPVVGFGDVGGLRTPAALLEAYGLTQWAPYGEDPPHVDVLRFESTPLTRLGKPDPDAPPVPWPTYATGFLPTREAIVPVYWLTHTRIPTGAEVWRIYGSGKPQEPLAVYQGPALGWKGIQPYVVPAQFIGPRAVWNGMELPASFPRRDAEHVELVAAGETGPDGFEQVRPTIWRRVVPIAECERVFELHLRCRWQGTPARVLQSTGEQALLLVEAHDQAWAERAVAEEAVDMLEPGRWRAVAPISELTDQDGSTFELPIGRPSPGAQAPQPGQAAPDRPRQGWRRGKRNR